MGKLVGGHGRVLGVERHTPKPYKCGITGFIAKIFVLQSPKTLESLLQLIRFCWARSWPGDRWSP